MGTYLYTTSPAAMADVEIEFNDGTRSCHTIHLYKYASKPYGIVDDYSERLVKTAETRFERSSVQVQKLGTLVYGSGGNDRNPAIVIGNDIFETHGFVSAFDDYVKPVGKIVRVLSKPKMVRVKAA